MIFKKFEGRYGTRYARELEAGSSPDEIKNFVQPFTLDWLEVLNRILVLLILMY